MSWQYKFPGKLLKEMLLVCNHVFITIMYAKLLESTSNSSPLPRRTHLNLWPRPKHPIIIHTVHKFLPRSARPHNLRRWCPRNLQAGVAPIRRRRAGREMSALLLFPYRAPAHTAARFGAFRNILEDSCGEEALVKGLVAVRVARCIHFVEIRHVGDSIHARVARRAARAGGGEGSCVLDVKVGLAVADVVRATFKIGE